MIRPASIVVISLIVYFSYFLCSSKGLASAIEKQKTKLNRNEYDFTKNWLKTSQPQWNNLVSVELFPNRPVNILEIGSFEGRTTVWMLENLCIHPESNLTVIDTFGGSMHYQMNKDLYRNRMDVPGSERRFLHNVEVSGQGHKVRLLKGHSMDRLIELNMKLKEDPSNLFDFVYIDGSHNAEDVLGDAVLVWPLLKENGIIIFDDYSFVFEEKYNNPEIAIDAFVKCFEANVEVLTKNQQMTIRKVTRQRSFTLKKGYYKRQSV